jgi:hypothetical protein
MADRKLDLENVRVIGEWTFHGKRAHFSIIFPPEEHFVVGSVGDDDEMRFRSQFNEGLRGRQPDNQLLAPSVTSNRDGLLPLK